MSETFTPCTVDRRLQGIVGLNPLSMHAASPRLQMFASQSTQRLVVSGMTERRFFSGMEQEFGKYTFKVEMPCNGKVIEVIPKYMTNGIGQDAIQQNPTVYLVFENVETYEVDFLEIPSYCSYHSHFGFSYVFGEGIDYLIPGKTIPKGTVFADSPGVLPSGNYMTGLELNIAHMSHPATSEDGIVICEDLIPRLMYQTFERVTVSWGKKSFPLNLYGDDNVYKPFPDIGDKIRSDRLLAALRDYDEDMFLSTQNRHETRRVDQIYDRRFYSDKAEGTILDINVITNRGFGAEQEDTDTQLAKYIQQIRSRYNKFLNVQQRLEKQRGGALSTTKRFHAKIVEALRFNYEDNNHKVKRYYRRQPMDDYTVEFVIRHDNYPNMGAKLVNGTGGKGVVCGILPREQMPMDAAGNKADIMMDPNSIMNRMIPSILFESYFNAAARDNTIRMANFLGLQVGSTIEQVELVQQTNPVKFEEAYALCVKHMELVSPVTHAAMTKADISDEEKLEYLGGFIQGGISNYAPQEYSPEYHKSVVTMEEISPPTYGPVTFMDPSGRKVTTKVPVRISSVHIMPLEKTGDEWSAVASAKTQHFGMVARIGKADRKADPIYMQPIRTGGETEVRIYTSYASPVATAEIMDRNNNPIAHAFGIESILRAKKPTQIKVLVDRNKVKLGSTKPLQILNHISFCAGWRIVYKQQTPRDLPKPVRLPAINLIKD